jgi:hypothetical protein
VLEPGGYCGLWINQAPDLNDINLSRANDLSESRHVAEKARRQAHVGPDVTRRPESVHVNWPDLETTSPKARPGIPGFVGHDYERLITTLGQRSGEPQCLIVRTTENLEMNNVEYSPHCWGGRQNSG